MIHPPSSILQPPRRRRSGYVLVVTLALLVLAASLMVAVSRGALRHQTAARLATDELQHRWGLVSCRQALLPHADTLLLYAEAERKAPLPFYRTQIRLGAETFDLTLADEQAKANVNVLLDHTDRSTAETRLRAGLGNSGVALKVHLRPSGSPIPVAPTTQKVSATQPAALPQFISGFGQIFDDASVDRLLTNRAAADLRLADLLTCWGTGQVNLRRVTPEALRIVAGPLTTIEQNRLLESRNALFAGKGLPKPATGPVDSDPIRRILAAARVTTQRGAPAFTGNSACYSLWITTSDGRRVTHHFSLLDQTDKEHPRTAAFVW